MCTSLVASIFFSLVMACLYVTLYCTNVSPCSLENLLYSPPQMVPGTCLQPISHYLPHVSHQFQAPRICGGNTL
ncbi:hypothetical protein BJV78DRAFT_1252241 [Lactifluus subvellereus]|nr:hypothetical protein BJV78DRAFT_1252241 [Lactifluus subvellereus]